MLDENDKWPKKIKDLIYIDRGLNKIEKNYINKTLKVNGLRLLVNLRYPPDPIRYNKMKKCELIDELKYSRYS
tara:strand:- start:304 stop:522 length:219 start_codon:yes stop_codon:yes gene_type:complete